MVNIRMGPIVGTVTTSSVRVLLEFDENVSVIITATEVNNPETQITVTKNFLSKQPTGVTIENLKERTEYVISFKTSQDVTTSDIKFAKTDIEDANEHKVRIHTMSAFPQNVRLAVVSGNNQDFPSEVKNLYSVIENKLLPNSMKPLDGVIHAGNQIFVDQALERLKSMNNESDMEEALRSEYRKAWNDHSTWTLLKKTSNMMIPSERDYGHGDTNIKQVAKRVANQLQRQLYTDDLEGDTFTHAQKIGELIGLLFIDQYNYSFDIESIKAHFAEPPDEETPGGLLHGIKGLLVITNEPVIFLAPHQEHIKNKLSGIRTDGWAYGGHDEDRIQLLDFLFQWKTSGDNRQVLIVCGNSATCGGHTIITSSETEISQFVTSPVQSALLVNDITVDEINGNGTVGKYNYTHFDWVCAERNFGVVDIFQPGSTSRPTIEHFIIREKSSITRHGSEKAGRWQIEENEKHGCFQS